MRSLKSRNFLVMARCMASTLFCVTRERAVRNGARNYNQYAHTCNIKRTDGILVSSDGNFTVFRPPGTFRNFPGSPTDGGPLAVPHWISIDQLAAAKFWHGF
jgi:hypothetical protein